MIITIDYTAEGEAANEALTNESFQQALAHDLARNLGFTLLRKKVDRFGLRVTISDGPHAAITDLEAKQLMKLEPMVKHAMGNNGPSPQKRKAKRLKRKK